MWPGWEVWNHKTTGGMRTVIPLQQQQHENFVCGRYRVLRVQCCFSLFFVLICDTHRNGKKKCVARAAHGGGSGRYRIGRMEKNANGVTTQPKSHTHGQIWRGSNNSCCGSCRLAWSWCGMSITTTTKTRLEWRGRFFTVLHVKNCVAACRMSRVTSL